MESKLSYTKIAINERIKKIKELYKKEFKNEPEINLVYEDDEFKPVFIDFELFEWMTRLILLPQRYRLSITTKSGFKYVEKSFLGHEIPHVVKKEVYQILKDEEIKEIEIIRILDDECFRRLEV